MSASSGCQRLEFRCRTLLNYIIFIVTALFVVLGDFFFGRWFFIVGTFINGTFV